ncbi:MAG: nuclear transport factor 2 family protein [Gammaproteobacteria bacterium]
MEKLLLALALLISGFSVLAAPGPDCSPEHALALVAALDTEYQAAVAKNDAATMDRLLANDFILVNGKGAVYTKADFLTEARSGRIIYERQDDSRQKVRVWGKTAVLTALLWAKGSEGGKPFEYRAWFSDMYLCTATGWRYTFAQSAQRLADAPKT